MLDRRRRRRRRRRRVLLTTPSTCRGEIFRSLGQKIPEKSTLIFGDSKISL